MMRSADPAIYSHATKFLLDGGGSENSTRPCRSEILNCGEGAALISARRCYGVLKGILALARRGCGPPRRLLGIGFAHATERRVVAWQTLIAAGRILSCCQRALSGVVDPIAKVLLLP